MHVLVLLATSLLLSGSAYDDPRCGVRFWIPPGWTATPQTHMIDEGAVPSCDVVLRREGSDDDDITIQVFPGPGWCFNEVAPLSGFARRNGQWICTSNIPPTATEFSEFRGHQILSGYPRFYYGDDKEVPGGLHKRTVVGDETMALEILSVESARSAHDVIVRTLEYRMPSGN